MGFDTDDIDKESLISRAASKGASDWTKLRPQNILIYGESKTGKTFLAASKIKQMLEANDDAQAWVLNTDMGFVEPALEIGLDKYKDRVHYHYLQNIRQANEVFKEIGPKIKPYDVLLFDLVSWIWDESQKEFINELSSGEPVGFIQKAMKDPKKFGTFEGMQWGYIKKVDDMISSKLTRNPICQVIGITSIKDVSVEYALNKKEQDIWVNIGAPAGRKDIMYEFATIVRIKKEDKGKRSFMVVGTRSGDLDYKWHTFDEPEDFWTKLQGSLKR